MASDSNTRSLDKGFVGDPVRRGMQQGLLAGIPAAEGMEGDPTCGQVELRTDQAMDPGRRDRIGPAQDVRLPVVVGSTEKDHAALQGALQVQGPADRERPAGRRRGAAGSASAAQGLDVLSGLGLQRRERGVFESRPDLALPAAIEVLDRRLKASLPRRHKDWHDVEAQTDAGDSADTVRVLVRPPKAAVVVELRVGRSPDTGPMLDQRFHRHFRGDLATRPRRRQAAMQRDGGQYLDIRATPDYQTSHDVEAIEFRHALCDGWQVPPAGRGRPSQPSEAIQGAAALQNTPNGANRGHSWLQEPLQFAVNGPRAVLAQVAGLLQPAPQAQDQLLEVGRDPIRGGPAATRPVLPGRTVQPLLACSIHPPLDRRQTDLMRAGHGSHRDPTTDRLHHLAAPLGLGVFVPRQPPYATVFSALYRPRVADPPVTWGC